MALNTELYAALKRRFGRVKIANYGLKATMVPLSSNGKMESSPKGGEYYRVCCPRCRDRKYRLWISYLWGKRSPKTGKPIFHLYHCFNEECEKFGTNRLDLYDEICRVYSADNGEITDSDIASESERAPIVTTPGVCVPLHALAANHPACRFFYRRKFDPHEVSRAFGVSYCEEAYDWLSSGIRRIVQNRIIFPITAGGKQIAWQARYVGPDGSGAPPEDAPKYFTAPGFPKSQYLYNWDNAVRLKGQFGVVVEGVMDVARLPWSVASFGASLSTTQIDMLITLYGKGALVLLWDRDMSEKACSIRDRLHTSFNRGVACVVMPDDRDPADWETKLLVKYICDSAFKQGVRLSWMPM